MRKRYARKCQSTHFFIAEDQFFTCHKYENIFAQKLSRVVKLFTKITPLPPPSSLPRQRENRP